MLCALTRPARWCQILRIWQLMRINSTISLLAILMTVLLGQPAIAGEVPGLDKKVSINAREVPVDQFLSNLFGHIGVPVVVDAKVQGTVNGSWDSTAGVLLDKASRSFQLATYFDGITAYVYNDNDLAQQIMPVSGAVANNIIQYASSLELLDARNRLDRVGANGLRVVGTPRFVEQVKSVSRNLRSKQPAYKPLVVEKLFYLKHAWAQDITTDIGGQSVAIKGIASTLVDLLSDLPIGDSVFPASIGNDLTKLRPQSSNDGQSTMVGNNEGTTEGTTEGNATELTQPQINSSTLVRQSNHTKIDAKDVRIVAVPRLNAVLIRDLESHMDSYQALIDSLDIEPYMLEIEATIIDLNSDKSEELGVNWRAQRDDFNEALVGNGSPSDLALRPNSQITPVGNGGILSLAFGDERAKFLARIRALEETGDAEIVSKPHVVTLANVEAILDTTQSFFARVQAAEDAALFKISVGTTLRVTPHVYRDGSDTRIKLLINIQDGATSPDATVDAIPVIGQSQISTQAIVKAGDSLLIGGMVRESKRNGESKVPLLGDIPGLGSIFRTKTSSGSKVERLFLITPRLAYKNGFEKRMEGPVLQGEADNILDSSSDRLSAAKDLLNTARQRNLSASDRLEQNVEESEPQFSVEYQNEPSSPVNVANANASSRLSAHSEAIKDNLRVPAQAEESTAAETLIALDKGQDQPDAYDDGVWQEVTSAQNKPTAPTPEGSVNAVVVEAPVRNVPAHDIPISELPIETVHHQNSTAIDLLDLLEEESGWQEVGE